MTLNHRGVSVWLPLPLANCVPETDGVAFRKCKRLHLLLLGSIYYCVSHAILNESHRFEWRCCTRFIRMLNKFCA